MAQIAVVPGSFDPVTFGHLEVITRAARIFDEVRVVVVHNPDKPSGMFTPDERVALLERVVADAGLGAGAGAGLGAVHVDTWSSGLLVDYCRRVGAGVIVKGVRSGEDVAYETPMAVVNRDLAGVETVFVVPDPARSHVSSSLIRQVATLGGDVSPYVPAVVVAALAQRADPR